MNAGWRIYVEAKKKKINKCDQGLQLQSKNQQQREEYTSILVAKLQVSPTVACKTALLSTLKKPTTVPKDRAPTLQPKHNFGSKVSRSRARAARSTYQPKYRGLKFQLKVHQLDGGPRRTGRIAEPLKKRIGEEGSQGMET